MKEYETYLFDWDGTIASTLEVWVSVVITEFQDYGIAINNEQAVGTLGRFGTEFVRLGVKPADMKNFLKTVEEKSHQLVPEAKLYPQIRTVLESLHSRGKKTALITTGWKRTIQHVLTIHNLNNVFDIVITADDVTAHKPDPEGIKMGLKYLAADAANAVFLGDSDKDLDAARNAGIDSILFYPPSHHAFYELDFLKQYRPTHIINDWNELL